MRMEILTLKTTDLSEKTSLCRKISTKLKWYRAKQEISCKKMREKIHMRCVLRCRANTLKIVHISHGASATLLSYAQFEKSKMLLHTEYEDNVRNRRSNRFSVVNSREPKSSCPHVPTLMLYFPCVAKCEKTRGTSYTLSHSLGHLCLITSASMAFKINNSKRQISRHYLKSMNQRKKTKKKRAEEHWTREST